MNHKSTVISLALCLTMVAFLAFQDLLAQDADTLDVPQGFETLNLAIEGDTTVTGAPKNPNRVYRLERGGVYLLNGTIKGLSGVPLRIVAAEGDGPMPILIPAADETGESSRAFRPGDDGMWKGLYITGIDNLGNQAGKNMFRCEKSGGRYIIDNCFLDSDAQSFVRMNSEEQKLYITNTIARNSFLLADPNNGRYIDTRSNTQDTIFVQNCTFYMNTGDVLRAQGGIIRNIIWDHVTVYQAADEMDIMAAINATITNNLFIDWGFEGDVMSVDPADSIESELFPIDTLGVGGLVPDAQRKLTITNNVIGYTPQILAWINSVDSLKLYEIHNEHSMGIINMFPNMVSENNISEYPEFSDSPSPDKILAYAQHRLATNFSNENNPDVRADRNGVGPLDTNPETIGPAQDEFDFDYSTTSRAYTHAQGGFPVGDLNWFPDKKAEWEQWVATGVEEDAVAGIPTGFELKQNYPNPFNPSTTIEYHLNRPAAVRLIIYNALGQKVRTLVTRDHQAAGKYTVQWDGKDDYGRLVASGLYMYRLESGRQVQMKKMLLMK